MLCEYSICLLSKFIKYGLANGFIQLLLIHKSQFKLLENNNPEKICLFVDKIVFVFVSDILENVTCVCSIRNSMHPTDQQPRILFIVILVSEFKQTNNNDLLEKDGGTKNCIYKD